LAFAQRAQTRAKGLTTRAPFLLTLVALTCVLLAQPRDELHQASEEPPLP